MGYVRVWWPPVVLGLVIAFLGIGVVEVAGLPAGSESVVPPEQTRPQSREPDEGFVAAIYRWATTGDLASALDASDIGRTGSPLSAGDFVRWCRQVLDLADQVRNAAPTAELRAVAKRAIADIRRGVVAVDAG